MQGSISASAAISVPADGPDIPLSTILSLLPLVRVPGVYLTSKIFPETLFPMGLATAGGSLVSVVICAGLFLLLQRQNPQKKKHIVAEHEKWKNGVAKSLKNDTLLKAQLKTCSIWKKRRFNIGNT